MNIAIGGKTFGRNSRFGIGLLLAALAAGSAIAAVWLATDSGTSRTEPVAAPAAVRPVEPATRAFTPVHYYLVDSDAQIDGLNQALFEAAQNFAGTASGESNHVIDLRTPEGQQIAQALQEDLYLAWSQNPDFDPALVQIHDLTGGIGASSTPARSSYTPAPAQATIYVVGSEAERQQVLYEADVAAAFEGSDSGLPVVVVVDPSDSEALQLEQAVTEDKLNGGIGANVIDLR
jgi:hypothetical protein